jgi:hypothetical protein
MLHKYYTSLFSALPEMRTFSRDTVLDMDCLNN